MVDTKPAQVLRFVSTILCLLSTGTAEEKSGNQRMGVPIADRRPDLPGQCLEYASPGAGTRRAAENSLPRLPAHDSYLGAPERRGRENGLRDAGPL